MKRIIINYLKDNVKNNGRQSGVFIDRLSEELNIPTSDLLGVLVELEKDDQLTIHQGINGPMIYLK
ncbi:hypothetical protein [Epilithonimonas arachidiradicis]|uniref:Winged helix-turn-helix protein DUF2582 n=1 Tax=Epilithonimonas arachidiradicis TaxID=1617282 RepID=A0A420D8R5_9FLAO|nr:hypothetical protein [Epilithonimonas arachidiradicis]RKE87171.1 hypothetical protein BXY58_2047 [Epilithonimonas arachidiradicis]GGG58822.1 hypothetical protein GCM10007332_20660 [Epilithonimonas arachidiradicis]